MNYTAEVLPSGFHRGNASSPFSHMFTSAGNRSSDIQQYSDSVGCEVCSGSNRVLSMCIHSSPALFPPQLHAAFLCPTAHNMAVMRQEKNAISLSFVLLFILKSVFIIASTRRAPLKGLYTLNIWVLGCVNKTFSVHQIFFHVKTFLYSVNALVSHTSTLSLWCCAGVCGWQLPPSILHTQ